jgi:hypothetical protein
MYSYIHKTSEGAAMMGKLVLFCVLLAALPLFSEVFQTGSAMKKSASSSPNGLGKIQ